EGAEAGDEARVQQQRLEAARRLPQPGAPRAGGEVERLRPQARRVEERVERPGVREQRRTAEAADVAEAQLTAVVQAEDQVRVLLDGIAGLEHTELAGHAEVDDEATVAAQLQRDPLAAAADGPDGAADQYLAPGPLPRLAERPLARPDRGETTAGQVRTQVADDRLDFRQLRHVVPPCEHHWADVDYKGRCRAAPS